MPVFFVCLFSSEVSRNLAPFRGFPLNDGIPEIVRIEPQLGSRNDLIELFCLRRTLEFSLALALLNPENGIVGVRIDSLVVQTLIPTEGKRMNDGEELPDVISAVNRTEMKHLIARLQIDGLIFHRPGITRTSGIHSPSVCPYFRMQRQDSIVAIIRRVLHHILSGTSIPSSPIPFLMILATFLASTRRKSFFCSSGSLRIE